MADPENTTQSLVRADAMRTLMERLFVRVGIPAGDAATAMGLGDTAVLGSTGYAGAKHPVLMAEAMRLAVDGGRKAFRAGRMPRRDYANASSPHAGLIE